MTFQAMVLAQADNCTWHTNECDRRNNRHVQKTRGVMPSDVVNLPPAVDRAVLQKFERP